ncbi:MAG: tetratricopeptide repeat protein [Chloroflexaceae bacterium]|nr:tetratricopeptide repeat protein [Chloroflexaceae bacterium]
MRQYEEAIAVMQQAITLRPGSSALYYNVGVLSQSAGRSREARASLEQALKLADTDPVFATPADREEFRQRVRGALRSA